MIVDDEALARSRLRSLVADALAPAAEVVAEAAVVGFTEILVVIGVEFAAGV